MFLLFILVILQLNIISGHVGEKPTTFKEFKPMIDRKINVDLNDVPHNIETRLGKVHTDAIMHRVHNWDENNLILEVRENTAEGNYEGWDLSKFDTATLDDNLHGAYNTKTTYKLNDNISNKYFSLDHPHHETYGGYVSELTDSHILYCQSDTNANTNIKESEYDYFKDIKEGSIVLGSTSGAWVDKPHIARFLIDIVTAADSTVLVHKLAPHEFHPGAEEPLFLYRSVVDVSTRKRVLEQTKEDCIHITTKTVHPFHLFQSIEIESMGDNPASVNYYEKDSNEEEEKKKIKW